MIMRDKEKYKKWKKKYEEHKEKSLERTKKWLKDYDEGKIK